MKLKSIEITGMHKIGKKSYSFEDITYLHGKNGAGKSTILQAIQLALLGYIPGQGKINEAIMRNANGNTMAVCATLTDGDQDVTIERAWVRTAKGVVSSVNIVPKDFDIAAALSDLVLPVFNFSEFLSLSANKQKDWFINFLPNAEKQIDWEAELSAYLIDIPLSDKTILLDALSRAEQLISTGVESVREMNQYFKDRLSFSKSELSRTQSTIDSLILYDDVDDSQSEYSLKAEIKGYRDRMIALNSALDTIHRNQSIMSQLEAFSDFADKLENDERAAFLSKSIADLKDKQAVNQAEAAKVYAEVYDLEHEIAETKELADCDGCCPYTHIPCASVVARSTESAARLSDLQAEYKARKHAYDQLTEEMAAIGNQIVSYTSELNQLTSDYIRRNNLQSSLLMPVGVSESTIKAELAELDNKLISADDMLSKILANERYNELIDRVTVEKFQLEQSIEVLKLWIKRTDVNGLQSELVSDPFQNISEVLTHYLQLVFDQEVAAEFNLKAKANSFSFGLNRDGCYIPFDLLSSGEKCLYTIALMACIISESHGDIKVMMIDDLLDHLDDDNIDVVFTAISKLADIQFIFAGVKMCDSANNFKVEI